MKEILTVAVGAVITGVFGLLGQWLQHTLDLRSEERRAAFARQTEDWERPVTPPGKRRRAPARLGLGLGAAVGLAAVGAVSLVLLDGDDDAAGEGGAVSPWAALVAVRDGALYTLDADGGGQRRITDGDADDFPDIRGDGTMVVFTRDADVWTLDRDGRAAALVESPLDETKPRWSPDGQRVAFDRQDPALGTRPFDVMVIDANGGAEENLTGDDGSGAGPDWSPDGRQVVYFRGARIWIMDADGENAHQVVSDHSVRPAWSPDGRRIAFACRETTHICVVARSEVDRAAANGAPIDGHGTVVTREPRPGTNGPSWSADSRTIAFEADDGLYTVEVDGSATQRLVEGGGWRSPTWNPDAGG